MENLLAMDIAATLLGCVHAMQRIFPELFTDDGGHNNGKRNCGIWVVLPEPVSPYCNFKVNSANENSIKKTKRKPRSHITFDNNYLIVLNLLH